MKRSHLWIEPQISSLLLKGCGVIRTDINNGEWVTFLGQGSQLCTVHENPESDRLGLLLNPSSVEMLIAVQLREHYRNKLSWKHRTAVVEVFCRAVFRDVDHDEVVILYSLDRDDGALLELTGEVAKEAANELYREHLTALDEAATKDAEMKINNEKIRKKLTEKGLLLNDWPQPVIEQPNLKPSAALIDALPVSAFMAWINDHAISLRYVSDRVAGSGHLPERSGCYTTISDLPGLQQDEFLLTWKPWRGSPSYPEVRFALRTTVPNAFVNPLYIDIARPDLPDDYSSPNLFSTSDVSEALKDTFIDDRDYTKRIEDIRHDLSESGIEAVAWFQGYHCWTEETWGIYIDAARLDNFALSLWHDARELKLHCSFGQIAFLALGITLAHERFHALVEAASSWQELASGRATHLRYLGDVYKALRGTDAWLEEALANWSSWSWFKNHGSSQMGLDQASASRYWITLVENALDCSPAGYREWRQGHDFTIWRMFSAQVSTGAQNCAPVPLDSILRGPFPFDLNDGDIPVRFVGKGTIASALLAHPATFNVPSRKEMEKVLRYFKYDRRASSGKGSHEKWTGPDKRAFSLPSRDPLSRTVFTSFLHHMGIDKEYYVREIRPKI